jgi:peptidoglycan/LPS O-acetylase OafA/YrhL
MDKRKFEILDGLRGVAALAVVFCHAGSLQVGGLNGGFLAVDLFFLMSGFVIGHAYEAKLLAGMSTMTFMRIRLLRLYPLYAAGTLLSIAYFVVVRFVTSEPTISFQDLAIQAIFAAFWLPFKGADPASPIFPLLLPAWSLFFEVLINVLYGLVVRRLSNRALILCVAISAMTLVAMTLQFSDLDLGWRWSSVVGGFPRVFFSFSAGLLIFRFRKRIPPISAPAPVLILASVAAFGLMPKGAMGLGYGLVVVLIGFPILVIAAIQSQPGRLRHVYTWAGAVSYPLYALHFPLITWGKGAVRMLDLPSMGGGLGSLLIAGFVLVSWLTLKLFDEPIRRILALPKPAAVAVSLD